METTTTREHEIAQLTEKLGITEGHYSYAFRRLKEWISYHFEIDSGNTFFLLAEYEELKGCEALLSMYGCILWTDEHKDEDSSDELKSGIAHDLNGRKDKFMVPRTHNDGYLNHYVDRC